MVKSKKPGEKKKTRADESGDDEDFGFDGASDSGDDAADRLLPGGAPDLSLDALRKVCACASAGALKQNVDLLHNGCTRQVRRHRFWNAAIGGR